MRKLIKPISIILTIAYLILIPFTALGATVTNGSTGDTALFNKWKGLGFLDKSASSSELYQPIQKIDFITFINDILKTSKQAEIGFNDVPKDSWYGAETAKAVASGYVSNEDKTNFNPFSTLTRLDAAIMVSKAFGLELNDRKLLIKITDAQQLDTDQLTAFGAVVEKGYISEISSGRYAPLGVLKLIDAIKMLDKSIGLVITKSGTITSDASGNMIINSSSVVLKDMKITGDLIIAEGVLDGTVRLENVSVSGKMIVRGGGTNGITIKNSNISGNLIVEKFTGNVNVVAQGTTTIEKTFLKSGGRLSEVNLTSGKGFVNVAAAEAVAVNQTANLDGEYNNIYMEGSNINIKLNGKVENVNLLKDTISRFSLLSGSVKNITTYAEKGAIELLGGAVTVLNVEEGAKGNKIDINGVTTVNKMNISDTTAINFDKGSVETLTFNPPSAGSYLKMKKDAYVKNVVANAAASISGLGKIDNAHVYANDVSFDIRPSSFYVASGIASNINGTIIDPTKSNVSFSVNGGIDKVTVQEGKTENLNVSNIVPTGTTLAYISSDNSIATISDKGEIKGITAGLTKLHVTGQYPSYNTKVADIEVIVTSGNVTGIGSLEIDPSSEESGKSNINFVITYKAGDDMSNGTVIIKLPQGFPVFETDTVKINNGEEKTLDSSQRTDIQTLMFTNLNLLHDDLIVVKLKNRIVPTGGQYIFTAISDADGSGPMLATTEGQEKGVFTSDKLRELILDFNYSTPEAGSTGGTTKISTLSFAGFTGATKWLVKVQDATKPSYDDVVTGTVYNEGDNISVAVNQNLMLLAVSEAEGIYKVKAYANINITKEMIRPNDAVELVLATNYNNPIPGIQAGTVRITGLNLKDLDASASKWMIKVQDTVSSTVFVDTVFVDATPYIDGNDISVYENQYIVLAAVDSANKVKAFTNITVDKNAISKPANSLILGNNFSIPTYGAATGTTKFDTLAKGSFEIDKWMIVTLSKEAVKPAINVSTTEFERYTEGKFFTEYVAKGDITAIDGQHLLLVGVDVVGTSNKITAYVDLTLDATQIRQANVILIPNDNIGAPIMGSKEFTTRLPGLNVNKSTTEPPLPADVTKYMVKVQDEGVVPAPQLNSMLSGAVDCVANQDIVAAAGQTMILIATDANGRIKAYRTIVINSSQIRPADAMKLQIQSDYSLPQPGSVNGSTKIVLSSNGVPNFSAWRYKIQDTPFEIPFKGGEITGTNPDTKPDTYNSGDDILNMSVGQHILIIAVDAAGKTLAYLDASISYEQIKQPDAGSLKSSTEVAPNENYNYSVPEPGQIGGTTRITSLNTMGVQGAIKWLYKISDTAVTTPEYNSVMSGLLSYTAGDSIKVIKNQYFVLYAVDDKNRIKAFRNIEISNDSQIRTPSATLLVPPTNYSVPAAGSDVGTTVLSSLSFAGLEGQNATWKWKYVVGDAIFSAPAINTSASAIAAQYPTVKDLEKIGDKYPDILVKAGQYILLLANDSSGAVKGYASIYVSQSAIRPYNSLDIDPTSYTLTKGTSEGTTRFSKLDLIGIVGATSWMIKTQQSAFDIPAKDLAVSGALAYSLNSNIPINVDGHILLLATDQLGRVKAYADITVAKGVIQAPFAMLLTVNTNYTDPEQGNNPGTVKIMLSDTGITKASGETIIWKYKKGTEAFSTPHLDDDASGAEYIAYNSNDDITVAAGNILLVVAVAKDGSGNEKIKAFRQFTISSSQIKPANAPDLVVNYNYTGPLAGSAPGTTKINDLKLISVIGADRWQIKVADTDAILTLNSTFTNPINYASGMDITVKLNQYVVLAAVDASGKVKAYKNIKITLLGTELNPPLADKLVSGLNYANPKYGTVTGTTSIYVSPEGLNGDVEFVAKVVAAPVSITSGTAITYTDAAGSSYSEFHSYTSGSNIDASAGQYILLVAVDDSGKVIAYDNIALTTSNIRPGNAVKLKLPDNYAALEPGAGVGTTKFTFLDFVGVPGAEKWIVKVQDVDLTSVPMINTSVEGAVVYDVNKDIPAKEGQYVVLYAVDTTGKIKGYISIPVIATNVRGIAPLLKINDEYYAPVPGVQLNTTQFAALKLPTEADTTLWKWKYVVQDNPAGTLLKDSLLTGLSLYTQGADITAVEGQHLILVVTDNNGYLKAYADVLVTAGNLKNVTANLSGTIITAPTGESNIVSGGRTITVTLDIAEWQDDVLTNTTKRNILFDGFIATGDEQAQWGKVIATLKTEGMKATSLSSDKKSITITLSEAATYDITKTQEVSLTLKPELIKNAVKSATSINKINISADVIVQLGGTAITQGLGEGDISVGGKTIIINLTNGEFAADVASIKVKRDAIFAGFKATYNTVEWAKVVEALKTTADAANQTTITRNASNKITIVLPAVAGVGGYDITMNETINLTIPYMTVSGSTEHNILVGAIKDVPVLTQLTISANAAAELTGTLLTGSISENNIVTGSKTIVITLTDGQWVTDIDTNVTKRNALFAGLGASAETAEWNKVVTALQTAGQAAITRTNNNTVTIILPAVPTYNISSNQYIVMNIPAACIIGAKGSLIAKQTIIVERVAGATLSGTAVASTVTETDIKLGGKTVIITLNNNASWVDGITTDTTIKNALFDGFVADIEHATQWAKVVSALKSGLGSITKTATNSITITLPTVIGYDITAAKQNISVTIPTSAVIGSSFSIPASNMLTINSTPPTAAKIVEVKAATGIYKLGDVVKINVRFDTEVDVAGVPVINLETGNIDRNAYYTTGSGIDILTFEYTVQADDTNQKLEYKTIDSLVLQGAAILNMGSSVKAVTKLPSPGSTSSLGMSNVYIDAVSPKLATGYPQKSTITELTAEILVKVDEKAKIYFVTVLNDISNVAPSVDQVINGQNSSATPVAANMMGMLDIVENTEGTLAVTGLTAYTDYTMYMVTVDSLGNKSSPVTTFNFKTLDTTLPEFTTNYPVQSGTKYDNKIDIVIKTNEPGKVYLVALPAGSIAPTNTQVRAFKNGSDGAVATNLRATAAITKDTEITLSVTGLTVSTVYDIYVVCEDASLNIINTPAKVSATTSQLNLDNVDVDLSLKRLTNTTIQMEYSFDEMLWNKCTATNTNITFDDSAEILTIYIREASNISNKRLLLPIRESADVINVALIGYDIAAKSITNTSTTNLQYRINGGTWVALNASSLAANVEFMPGLLEVRTASTALTATEKSKLPSIPVLVDNIAVPMPAPNLAYSDNENIIQGLDSTYEYSIDNGLWKTGAADGTFAGTKKVEVRQKATKDKLPSVGQIIEFTAGTIKVVAAPAAATETSFVSSVTIAFEENTNKIALTPQKIRDYFLVGTLSTTSSAIATQHYWGDDSDITAAWNTAGNVLTIKFKTMAATNPVKIDDGVIIDALAGIKNAAGTSASYTSTGVLTGSFHTVPAIKSIEAVNSGNDIGFGNGDSIVITFDQKTNKKAITAAQLDTILKITDPINNAITKTWGITKDSAIFWNVDGTELTINFDAASIAATQLKLSYKITVDTSWGLTDEDLTTAICNSSAYISGSFTSTPIITSVIIANTGVAGTKAIGDTITINFDQATNKKVITAALLIKYFTLLAPDGKTAHSWGVQSDLKITWNTAGTALTIELNSISGVTLAAGDKLTIDSKVGIMAADGGTLAVGSTTVGSSKVITGGY